MGSGNHIADQEDKERNKGCIHSHIKTKDWCHGRNMECQAQDCGVLDDDIPNCNELVAKEICQDCLMEVK